MLARRIGAEGLRQRRPAYYLARLSLVTLMFLGGWKAFFLIRIVLVAAVTAAFLAVTFGQAALVIHAVLKAGPDFTGRVAIVVQPNA
ncbi:hypothetical protein AB0J72_47825 [Dactylosporangium sp. NPDC049742]|uniref:hypothetical protein n=1 Tax=Dactylosporangium sp. NPDC049742 TaxID=3154737 RepID=UPI00341D0419